MTPASTSAALNGLVNPGPLGIVVDRDILWVVCLACVHLVAVDEQLSWIVSKFSYRLPKPYFYLLCIMSVDSMRVCHDLRRSSEMVFFSYSPASTVSSAKGPDWYFVLMVVCIHCEFTFLSLKRRQNGTACGVTTAFICRPMGRCWESGTGSISVLLRYPAIRLVINTRYGL